MWWRFTSRERKKCAIRCGMTHFVSMSDRLADNATYYFIIFLPFCM